MVKECAKAEEELKWSRCFSAASLFREHNFMHLQAHDKKATSNRWWKWKLLLPTKMFSSLRVPSDFIGKLLERNDGGEDCVKLASWSAAMSAETSW
jgi:hypothetical protein